jgi:hypothetical protein
VPLVDETWQPLHKTTEQVADPGQTFLAVFDVLGFQNFVEGHQLREAVISLGAKVKEAIAAASFAGWYAGTNPPVPAPETRRCESVTFSDTIILYAPDDSAASFHAILAASRDLLEVAFGWAIPLRGAITRGELCAFADKSVIVGRGLVRGYVVEQKQDWAGAIIDPDLDLNAAGVGQFVGPLQNTGILVRYKAPMKAGPVKECLCIDWNRRAKYTDVEIAKAFEEAGGVREWDVARKRNATLEFARFCRTVSI